MADPIKKITEQLLTERGRSQDALQECGRLRIEISSMKSSYLNVQLERNDMEQSLNNFISELQDYKNNVSHAVQVEQALREDLQLKDPPSSIQRNFFKSLITVTSVTCLRNSARKTSYNSS